MIVVFYVDDLFLTRNNLDLIFQLKSWLVDTFEMKNLCILHFFLGIQVLPLSTGLFISPSKYVLDLLKHFKMDNYKECSTPFQLGVNFTKGFESSKVDSMIYRQLVGRLIYLTHSEPDIPLLSFWSPASCRILEKSNGKLQSVLFIIWRVLLSLVSNKVEVQIHWSSTPTPTKQAMVMIKNPLSASCFILVLAQWFGHLRNKR